MAKLSKIFGVITPPDFDDKDFWRKAVIFQLIYSLTGLVLGLICVIGGIILILHGIAGPTTSWTTKFLGFESNFSDATPGVILFIVGFLFVLATKFDIKANK
ncbi:hypothetical protein HZB05_01570 [Candidatus Wolfebacteria bacterium]|nr:hypothetical protein [Candidatus Wolfebacteria bacterium]